MIFLDVCCNDPDNGLFAGRAAMLQIGEAEFGLSRAREPAFVELAAGMQITGIRLAGKSWQVDGAKHGVGNWCWNRYLLARPAITARWYMVEFVTWLRARGLFHCESAPSEFFEWFNDGGDPSPAEVHRMLGALEP